MALNELRFWVLILVIVVSAVARAQDSTSQISVPTASDVNTSTSHVELPWMPPTPGRVSEIYNYTFRSNIANGPGTSDPTPSSSLGRTLRSINQSHLLGLRYGFTEKWGVRLVGSAQDNEYTVQKKDGTEENYYVQGIGDSKLQAVYEIYKDVFHRWEASGGTTIPTGATNLMGPNGHPLSPRNQLGSGTYDLVPELGYTFTKRGWEIGTRLAATFHLGENADGYTNGDEYGATSAINYLVFPFLAPSFTLSLRDKQRNTINNPQYSYGKLSANAQQPKTETPTGGVLPGPTSPGDSSMGSGWLFSGTAALRSNLPLAKGSPIRALVEVGIPVFTSGHSDTGMRTEWFAGSSLVGNF
jgi:hypothetical protein